MEQPNEASLRYCPVTDRSDIARPGFRYRQYTHFAAGIGLER
jgi:hypothetical protein